MVLLAACGQDVADTVDDNAVVSADTTDNGLARADVVAPDRLPPEGWSTDDGLQVTVEFTGRYVAESGEFEFEFEEPSVPISENGLRTVGQALWCSDRLTVVQDGVTGTNPPNTFELASASVGTYGDCDPATFPDGTPSGISYADLVNTEGALCSDITIRSFYPYAFDDVYAWIYEVNPIDNYAYTWGDRSIDGLGNGAEPPTGTNAPSDNRGGLFYYGEMAARDLTGAVDNALTEPWVFRYPIDGADFNFRGKLVARFTETCNGLDDDCDGRVDESIGCLPDGTFCVDDSDCISPTRCLTNVSTGTATCGGGVLPEDCTGTTDTNGDGFAGCEDPTCSGEPNCPDFSCAQGNLGQRISTLDGTFLVQGTHSEGAPSDVTFDIANQACGSRMQGADSAWLWTAPADGTYTISTAGSTFDTAILVLPAVCPLDGPGALSTNQLRCIDAGLPGAFGEELDIIAEAGESFYIVVDSAYLSSLSIGRGTYRLAIYKTSICGDFFVDTIDRLGNLTETCDVGAVDTTTCDRQCNERACNDGYINPTMETCEDGGVEPGDGCSPTCTTEAGWFCDPTGCVEVCGDGIVIPAPIGTEICDDDNQADGDGCAADCRSVETGWACPAGGACAEICNDGLAVGDEPCDSPLAIGCDDECRTVRAGYRCPDTGGSCTQIDECVEELDTCSEFATCADTPGSFTCTCNAGYLGDGELCVNIDECATDPCDAQASCLDTSGSFVCTCNAGFSGDGFVCEDINECLTNNGGCDVLTTCTNTIGGRTCSACPVGYSGTGETGCERRDCGEPAVPLNATVATAPADYRLGSTVVYSCNNGYTLSAGDLSRTCEPSGPTTVALSGNAPVCSPVSCGNVTTPPNSVLQGTVTSFVFGQSATFVCAPGFQLSGAPSLTVACQANGTYASPTGTCERRNCGTLSGPANGTLSAGDTLFGTTRTFSCNTGYTRVGAETATCQEDGTWSASAPTCQIVSCPVPTPPANSALSAGTWSFTYNETLSYTCLPGYVAQGSLAQTCQADGSYTAVAGSCVPRDCGTLSAPSNGTISAGATTFGTVRTLGCNVGYTLSGSTTRECGADGNWTGTATVCTIFDCGTAPTPTFGSISSSTGTTFNSSVTYACDTGFTRTAGDSGLTCSASGWVGIVPTCSRVTCPSVAPGGPEAPANATIATGGPAPFVFEDAVTFSCNEGFVQTGGNLSRTCTAAGTWSGTSPTCSPITCAFPGTPTDGFVLAPVTLPGAFQYNTTVQYECNNGFDPVGSQLLTCTGAATNGGWNFPVPTCAAGSCGDLPTVDFSTRSPLTPSTIVNVGQVTYTCNTGYNLTSGDAFRQCLPTGGGSGRAWTGTSPVCTPVSCGPLADPQGQDLTGGPYTDTFGEVRTYVCEAGWQLSSGTNSSILSRACGVVGGSPATGAWQAASGTCVRVNCPTLTAPTNGTLAAGNTEFETTRNFTCNDGYILQGSAARTCQADGNWSGTPVTCAPASCGTLGAPTNGPAPSVTTTVTGGSATYTCDAGYQISGSALRSCAATGPGTSAWTPAAPTCVPRTCTTFTTPTNGLPVSYTNAQNYLSEASFSCQPGYRLVGSASLTCAISGAGPNVAWNGSAPTCELIQCPVATAVANATVSTPNGREARDADQAIHTCADGWEPTPGNATTQTCTADAGDNGVWQWNGTPLTCRRRACANPPTVTNAGAPGFTAGPVLGSTASYSCNAGYVVSQPPAVTNATATCSFSAGNMVWTGVPTCSPISCGAWSPSSGANTTGAVTYTPSGSQVYLANASRQCLPGFRVGGTAGGAAAATASCGTLGSWTQTSGNCDEVQCPAAASVYGGGALISATNSTSYNATVAYQCPDGFISTDTDATRRASRQFGRTCGSTTLAQWTDLGACVQVACPASPGTNFSVSAANWGVSTNVDCNSGFFRGGTTQITCGYNATTPTTSTTGTWRQGATTGGTTWTTANTTCTAQTCPTLNGPAGNWSAGAVVGTVAYTSAQSLGSQATFTCPTGSTLSSATARVCTAAAQTATQGTWSNTTPICNNTNECPGACSGTGVLCGDRNPPDRFNCSCAVGYSGSAVNGGNTTCSAICGDATQVAPEVCDYGSQCNGTSPINTCANRCEGAACNSGTACNACTSTSTGLATRCTDGLDNDGDGTVDCNDSDCSGVEGCPNWAVCDANAITGFSNGIRVVEGTYQGQSLRIVDNNHSISGGHRNDGAFIWRPNQNNQFRRYQVETFCSGSMDPVLVISQDDAKCSGGGWWAEHNDIAFNAATCAFVGQDYDARIQFDPWFDRSWWTIVMDTDTDTVFPCEQPRPNNTTCRLDIWDIGCQSGYQTDHNGQCQPSSWIRDGSCDDGTYTPTGGIHPANFWNGTAAYPGEVCDCQAGNYNGIRTTCGIVTETACRRERRGCVFPWGRRSYRTRTCDACGCGACTDWGSWGNWGSCTTSGC